MAGKIPVRLRAKFIDFMDAHNFDDLPEGAWFTTLEQAGQEFIDSHKLKWIDGNDAAHHYLKLKG